MARIRKNPAGTKQTGVFTKKHGFITEKGWKFLVHKNPHWALKAVVELFGRQTTDEQVTRSTRWDNERGFRADDASRGTKLARRIVELKKVTNWSYKALANELKVERRDDFELALFLAKRYRQQCLNMIARAEGKQNDC